MCCLERVNIVDSLEMDSNEHTVFRDDRGRLRNGTRVVMVGQQTRELNPDLCDTVVGIHASSCGIRLHSCPAPEEEKTELTTPPPGHSTRNNLQDKQPIQGMTSDWFMAERDR